MTNKFIPAVLNYDENFEVIHWFDFVVLEVSGETDTDQLSLLLGKLDPNEIYENEGDRYNGPPTQEQLNTIHKLLVDLGINLIHIHPPVHMQYLLPIE